ncbi:ArsR family transcriptional regulator [Massilia arenosa]|uniref:ArsR family transcriptional regulator n=1 Tax=Zemynaea arenosa TaxID=2561931 RepID=A0A4Y9SJU9_9BURK|nr:metalloregulator ArsR/SmtB family transcription factor [Massilia arenosa]TFW21350.1 ArsR family transcriptional regulator [Massilia arenosa]
MSTADLTSRARQAAVFAALGDPTRLYLLDRLVVGPALSIAELTEGADLTRQAVTKHLHALEEVQLVKSMRAGRATLYEADAARLREARAYLDFVAGQWDDALARLAAHVDS